MVAVGFFDENGMDYLVQQVRDGLLGSNDINDFIRWASPFKLDMTALLVKKLNEFSETHYQLPEAKPKKNHVKLQNESLLAEKTLYFNKEKFISVIEEIFTAFGKDKFQKGEVYKIQLQKGKENEEIYERFPNSLLRDIDENYPRSKVELIERINKSWEWISIRQIKNFLKNHQHEIEKNPELDLSNAETSAIKSWCDNHLPKMNLSEQVTNGDIVFAWLTIRCKFTHYPEAVYLQMVDSNLQNHLDLNLIEFIQELQILPLQNLIDQILKILQTGEVEGYRVYNYLKFIENQHIHEALPVLIHFINFKSEHFDNRDFALRVFIALEGDKDYLIDLLKNLIPASDDHREQTLLEFFSQNPNKAFEDVLLNKLTSSPKIGHQLKYATYLFRTGNIVGLKFLIEYIKRERKSPFETHELRNIKFENPVGIPLFFRMFEYAQDKSIPQDVFNRLSYVGRIMLIHLATCQSHRYFSTVQSAIRWHLKLHNWLNKLPRFLRKWMYVAHPDGLKELQYLLKDLEIQHYQKQNLTIDEAVERWKKLS